MFATRLSTTRACQSVSRMIWTSQQLSASSKSSGETVKEKKPASSKKKAAKTETPTPAAATQTFDNTSYKATEYYNHNPYTFFDLDTEMLPSRLPQPSSLKKPAAS